MIGIPVEFGEEEERSIWLSHGNDLFIASEPGQWNEVKWVFDWKREWDEFFTL